MKKAILLVFVVISLNACNNEGSRTEIKLDSIKQELDSTAERSRDSTKAKAKEIKETVEGAFKKDSASN